MSFLEAWQRQVKNIVPRGLPVLPGRDRSRTSFFEACQSHLAETSQEYRSSRPVSLTWQRQVNRSTCLPDLPVLSGRDRSRTSFLESCQSHLAETGQEHRSARPVSLTWQRQCKNVIPRSLPVSPGRDRSRTLLEMGQEHHSLRPASLTWQRHNKCRCMYSGNILAT